MNENLYLLEKTAAAIFQPSCRFDRPRCHRLEREGCISGRADGRRHTKATLRRAPVPLRAGRRAACAGVFGAARKPKIRRRLLAAPRRCLVGWLHTYVQESL